MPDDLKRSAPEDPNFINVNQPHEVVFWTKELGVSEARLRHAVAAVGTSTAAVRKYLGLLR